MTKWRSSFALLAMGVACLAQTGDMVPPEVRRVGNRLACLCTSCNNTVATCQMVGCHYTAPARAQISAMVKEGKSDDEVVAFFVKREGKKGLAAPEASGVWIGGVAGAAVYGFGWGWDDFLVCAAEPEEGGGGFG